MTWVGAKWGLVSVGDVGCATRALWRPTAGIAVGCRGVTPVSAAYVAVTRTGAGPVSSEDELARLLQAVRDGDFADAPVDNEMLAAALQVSLVSVAACLQEATARSLVGGVRGGRQPGPWYTDLELTVQGQRFLSARQAQPDHRTRRPPPRR